MKRQIMDLIEVARGVKPPDLILKNGRVVNTFSCEVESMDVAIHEGIVVGLGVYDGPNIIDVEGDFLIPGFMDGHLHIESSMLSPLEFSKAVLPMGTTAVVADPHEIANVLGRKGIEYMLSAGDGLPVDIYLLIPSCVPATPMETSGALLEAKDLKGFIGKPRVLGLAEVMNFPGVVCGDDAVLSKIDTFRGHVIDGHAPLLSGKDLNAYILGGPGSDHECSVIHEAREKMRRGMVIMIREGSMAKNLKSLLPLVKPESARRFMFVTDDIHPDDLMEKGHINHILNMAISEGLDPLIAIQMATLNPAEYFGLKGMGAIAPGYKADILRVPSLKPITIRSVFKKGQRVFDGGQITYEFPSAPLRDDLSPMRIKPYQQDSFKIRAEGGKSIRVIGLIKDQIITEIKEAEPKVAEGLVLPDPDRDLLKIAVVERHKGTGNIGLGFVQGFGFKKGAIASSVSHDSHNVIAVGTNDEDIFLAVKETERIKGGSVVVSAGKVLASLPLPVAGLMSDRPLKEVADVWKRIEETARSLGSHLTHPFMALSFMALPVIPELKITDMGLIDVVRFKPVGLFL
ncbi:MAG: adenine deaminase [bacterium]